MRKRTARLLSPTVLIALLTALTLGVAVTAPWSPWLLVAVAGVLSVGVGLAMVRAARRSQRRRLAASAADVSGRTAGDAALVVEIDEIDGLTSLGNRRRLDQDLRSMLERGADANVPVALAVINVDNFRLYNEAHGHVAGDEVLQLLARVIAANIRAGDVVYRYGGEEFSVLFPGANRGLAHEIVHRVRAAIEATAVPGEASQPGGSLTVSVGVSAAPQCGLAALTQQAHEALSHAKGAGRNQVAFAAPCPEPEHGRGTPTSHLGTPTPTPVA